MKPDWQTADGSVQLYRGDCLEILPQLPEGSVDAVVTDPPYGVRFEYLSHDDCPEKWFLLMDSVVPELKRIAQFVVLPAGQRSRLAWWYESHAPTWQICWDKGSPGTRSPIGFEDWECLLAWGRPNIPMHDIVRINGAAPKNGHPCPKPLAWSLWLCLRAAEHHGTILDPFMGSGTTGVACVRTGRKFIGIEVEPRYFDIAVKRIEAELNRTPLFDEPPQIVQRNMLEDSA